MPIGRSSLAQQTFQFQSPERPETKVKSGAGDKEGATSARRNCKGKREYDQVGACEETDGGGRTGREDRGQEEKGYPMKSSFLFQVLGNPLS